MKNLIDIHTHSIASGHAFSTVLENVHYASIKGLKYYGLSDHAPNIPGGPHSIYFRNLKVIPDIIENVRVLKGVELNILDENCKVDLSESTIKNMDYTIASIHGPCFMKNSTFEDVTNAYLKACDNKYITIIGHMENGNYMCDYDRICEYASKTNTLIELNNSSLIPGSSRLDSNIHMPQLLKACMKYHTYVIMNSDAHIALDVGSDDKVTKMLEDTEFDLDLVVNYHEELIEKFIINNCKKNS